MSIFTGAWLPRGRGSPSADSIPRKLRSTSIRPAATSTWRMASEHERDEHPLLADLEQVARWRREHAPDLPDALDPGADEVGDQPLPGRQRGVGLGDAELLAPDGGRPVAVDDRAKADQRSRGGPVTALDRAAATSHPHLRADRQRIATARFALERILDPEAPVQSVDAAHAPDLDQTLLGGQSTTSTSTRRPCLVPVARAT